MAWHTAALHKAQKLPSLADLIGPAKQKPMTWQQMRNTAMVMTQLMGGSVRHRTAAAAE